MNKRYWDHEPIKGMKEYYDSDDWFGVVILWFLARILGIAIILGGFLLFSLLAK
jgi:hypothetical protein